MNHPAEKFTRAIPITLIGVGVKDIIYCPGSHSAPFTYAFDITCQAGHLHAHVRLNERSAAFLTLGLSRAGRSEEDGAESEPALSTLKFCPRLTSITIIVTSGEAAVELHAGTAEAKHSRLPLFVTSADCPARIREVGASQTTSQSGIFSSHALEALDLSTEITSDQSLDTRVRRLFTHAEGIPTRTPGLVQPSVVSHESLTPEGSSTTPVPFLLEGEPTKVLHAPTPRAEWKEAVREGICTLILAGDGADPDASIWASRTVLPILVEPPSGLVWGGNVIPYQQSLLSGLLARSVGQMVVTGRSTLSRSVSMLLARTNLRLVIIGSSPEWTDVSGNAALVVSGLSAPYEPVNYDQGSWFEEWREAALETGEKTTHFVGDEPPSVLDVAHTTMVKGTRTLLLNASDSVHAVSLVSRTNAKHLVVVNHGLVGIDGTLVTGIGLALARGEAVTIPLGDLAFCHDVEVLAIPAEERISDLLITVADDSGRGIFAGLEHGLKENALTFERRFTTAQSTPVRGLAAAYGADYRGAHMRAESGELIDEGGRGIRIL